MGGQALTHDKKRLFAGAAAALLFIAAFFFTIWFLFTLSKPSEDVSDILYQYSEDGWVFETKDGCITPVFNENGFMSDIPADSYEPVAVSRTLEDMGCRDLLKLEYIDLGTQIFIGSDLLYTDFPNMDNRLGSFLENADTSGIGSRSLTISLPSDYAGKKLCIVWYGIPYDDGIMIPYFSIGNRFYDAYVLTTQDVPRITATALLMLLGLLLLFLFMIGILYGGRIQLSLLPLTLYFMLTGVSVIANSSLPSAIGMDVDAVTLHMIRAACVALLMLFLAMNMTGWRAKALLAATVLFFAARIYCALNAPWINAGLFGLALITFAAILMLFSRRENILFRIGFICIAVFAVIIILSASAERLLGIRLPEGMTTPVITMFASDWGLPVFHIMSGLLVIIPTIWAVATISGSIFSLKRRELALGLNNKMAQESYAAAQDAIKQTSAMRHDWKNQITALHLLWEQGSYEELGNSLKSLDKQLDRLTYKQYSNNFTVNTILQNTGAKAAELGITFHAYAPVDKTISIDENDLCSLLFNIFDNALEASSKMPEGKREISCVIKTAQGYLAIKCENTYTGQLATDPHGKLKTTNSDTSLHGFGLVQMRTIAEKYNGMLSVRHGSGMFTVEAALKL